MSKQTAVEWLVKIYLQKGKIDSFDIEQAKQMEKEQHKDTYVAAMARPVIMDINPFDQAEQYFNQTYNKNKQ